MSLSSVMRGIFTRQGIVLLLVPFVASLVWLIHFTLEFTLLDRVGLPPIFVLVHLGLVGVGAAIYTWYGSQVRPYRLLVFSIIALLLITAGYVFLPALNIPLLHRHLLAVGLLGATGIAVGILLPPLILVMSPILKTPEFNGEMYYLGSIVLSVMVIIWTLFDGFVPSLREPLLSSLLLFTALVSLLLLTQGRAQVDALSPRSSLIMPLFRKPGVTLSFLLMFFSGFFFANSYYAVVLILPPSPLITSLHDFVIVFFLTCVVMSLPAGVFYDRIGRRWGQLLGFYIISIAFLLVTIFRSLGYSELFVVGTIFSVTLGVGFTLSIFGSFLYSFELIPRGGERLHQGVSWIFFGVGLTLGVVTDSVLVAHIIAEPATLPIVLIFALFTATMVVIQLPETLPSREELDWKNKIEYLLVVNKGGLPLYSERLSRHGAEQARPDEMLVSGAISGITELVREISQREAKMKVIQQEGYCIMLEEGRDIIVALMALEELKEIRRRLQDFLEEFERFFGRLVTEWGGDPAVFSPTAEIVARHFS